MLNKQDEFILSLMQNDLSENTVNAIKNALKMFYKWSQCNEATPELLLKYKKYLIENKKASSVNQNIWALNKYLDFLGSDFKLKQIKKNTSSFCDNVITEEDYYKLLAYCEKNKKLTNRLDKHYCIIKILATTGIRVSELSKIKYEDYVKGYADIVSKANHARRVYISKETADVVLAYCEQRGTKNPFNFKNQNRAVASALNYIAKRCGIDPKTTHPHAFRHFFAKKFLKKNNDISLLADILGHASIKTTALYLRQSQKEQENNFRKVVDW